MVYAGILSILQHLQIWGTPLAHVNQSKLNLRIAPDEMGDPGPQASSQLERVMLWKTSHGNSMLWLQIDRRLKRRLKRLLAV